MSAVWPAYAAVAADGQGLGQDGDVERTPWDDGLVRQERRATAALETARIAAWLDDDAALTAFRAWARAHAHGWFEWTDQGGEARRARVRGGAGGIAFTARVRGGRRRWEARCELEWLAGRTGR